MDMAANVTAISGSLWRAPYVPEGLRLSKDWKHSLFSVFINSMLWSDLNPHWIHKYSSASHIAFSVHHMSN